MNIGTIKSTLDSLDLLKMKKDGVGTNIFNQRIFAKWRWQLKKFGNHWRDSTFGVSNYRIELIEATSISRMTITSFWKYAFLVPFSQITLVSWNPYQVWNMLPSSVRFHPFFSTASWAKWSKSSSEKCWLPRSIKIIVFHGNYYRYHELKFCFTLIE